jgi:hypothetical protein
MNDLNNDWVLWMSIGAIVVSTVITLWLVKKVFAASEDDSLK